jgi:hypothetical protein
MGLRFEVRQILAPISTFESSGASGKFNFGASLSPLLWPGQMNVFSVFFCEAGHLKTQLNTLS